MIALLLVSISAALISMVWAGYALQRMEEATREVERRLRHRMKHQKPLHEETPP